MKRLISLALAIALLLTMGTQAATADEDRKSGAFTYRIKGNGTVAITGYDWSNNKGKDIFIPQMLDGYTVTEIADFAFGEVYWDTLGAPSDKRDDSRLASGLVIPNTVLNIGDAVFWGVNFETKVINIPSGVQYIGSGAFSNISGIEQFVVDSGNPIYSTIDGVLYDKKEKALVAYPPEKIGKPGTKVGPTFVVPTGIKSIGDYAFFNVDFGLDKTTYEARRISLPDTLESIGEYSFAYTYIPTHSVKRNGAGARGYKQYLILPESVSQIGMGAFYCPTETWDGIDLSATKLREIPSAAFSYCRIFNSIKLPDTLETVGMFAFYNLNNYGGTMGLPASVTTIDDCAFNSSNISHIAIPINSKLRIIGEGAFYGADLTGTVTIPSGVEEIGDSVFDKCDNITDIKLPASVKHIGEDFCVRNKVYLDVEDGSYAALWAAENGYMVQSAVTEDTSWLND